MLIGDIVAVRRPSASCTRGSELLAYRRHRHHLHLAQNLLHLLHNQLHARTQLFLCAARLQRQLKSCRAPAKTAPLLPRRKVAKVAHRAPARRACAHSQTQPATWPRDPPTDRVRPSPFPIPYAQLLRRRSRTLGSVRRLHFARRLLISGSLHPARPVSISRGSNTFNSVSFSGMSPGFLLAVKLPHFCWSCLDSPTAASIPFIPQSPDLLDPNRHSVVGSGFPARATFSQVGAGRGRLPRFRL